MSDDARTDADLLQRYLAARDEPAFAELVRRNINLVYGAALRRTGGDAHRAADIAQQVFIAVARNAGKLARHESLTGWLYTTTRNAAFNLMRDEQRRRNYEQAADAAARIHAESAADEAWRKLRPELDAAMDELGERDREAVLWRFFEGRALAEIGLRLRVSENAARMRVDRALDKLRDVLMRRGVTSTSAALGVVLTSQAGATPASMALVTSVTGAALAGVAAPVAAGSWLAFMTANEALTAAAALVLLVTGGIALRDARAAGDVEAQLAAERQRVFRLALRVDDAERAVRVASAARSALSPGTSDAAAAQPEEEVRGPFGETSPGARARGRALMTAYPELQRLVTELMRGRMNEHYRRFYREAGLTAEQIDAFEMIKVAGVSSTMPWFGDGEPLTPNGNVDLRKLPNITFDAAPVLSEEEKAARLRELLGPWNYERLQEYEKSGHGLLGQLASTLAFTADPLTADQAARLTQLVAERNRAMPRAESAEEYWAPVRAQAAEFLSPPQLAAIKRLQAHEDLSAFLSRRRQEAATKK